MAPPLMGPIMITGAAGFIGSNLVRHYATAAARVVAVGHADASTWRLEGLPGNVEHAAIDVCSAREVNGILDAAQPQVILHCAAFGAYPNQTDAEHIYRVNFEGVRHMLEGARRLTGLRAFIQLGTSSEYGANCSGPGEDAPTAPDSDYAVSKVAATALVGFYGLKYRLPAWVLRLYSAYGPYEDPSRLVPRLLAAAKKNQLPPLVDPSISRDYVHVGDACAACDAVIEKAGSGALRPGDVFNIGSGRKTTLEDIVAIVRKLCAVSARPDWGSMPNRRWDHPDWYAEPAKAKAVLGWWARTTLPDGLAATVAWMEGHRALLELAERQSVATTTRS
jgi:polyisoprenyl-phosphate glycosyltransferase